MKTNFRAERHVWKDGIDVYAYEKDGDEIHVHLYAVERKTYQRHACIPDPPGLQFTVEEAQELFDELWRVGMRPRNGESSMAHVDAVKAHLADMQRLAFAARG